MNSRNFGPEISEAEEKEEDENNIFA